jgi:hypothetical protein
MRDELIGRIHAIEEAYEFMLAYAAQGLPGDGGTQSGGELRTFLDRAATAISGISAAFTGIVRGDGLEPAKTYAAFGEVLDRDARAALAAIELVRAQQSISSQLIDNLNASIHVRALLTDLFLVDELLKPAGIIRDQGPGIGDQTTQ